VEVKEGDEVALTPDVIKPEPLSKVNPTYPSLAKQKKIEGTVFLSALISERGDVIDVKVIKPAGGNAGLNEAAVSAVQKWKFRPAVKEGKRVKVRLTIPVAFKIT
jgi:TonB family protein